MRSRRATARGGANFHPIAGRASPAMTMSLSSEEQVTRAVPAQLAGCPDARLQSVRAALVRHLHAFVSEGDGWSVDCDFVLEPAAA